MFLIYFIILTQGHFLLLFRERKRKGERETLMQEKHQLVASCMHLDWGSNLQSRYVA